MNIRHLIFDCDGVLIDSEGISMHVDHLLLCESGIDLGEDEVHRRFVGQTFSDMVRSIEAEFGCSLPGDLEARKDSMMLEIYRKDLRAIDGIGATLAVLAQPKSVGTNGPRHRASEALRITGIAHHFAAMTTFEDVTNPKPAPDIYVLAAQRAGFAPRHCAVIEDSTTGITAAVAAGCVALGFTGAYADRVAHGRKLADLGARLVFDDMAKLPEILKVLS